jgi:hypothetical protein
MTATETVTSDARAVARRFIEAFNARDLEALRALITEDAEFRTLNGDALRGHDGARALLEAARDLDLRLVPFRGETVEDEDGVVRVRVPLRELIGPDDIERTAVFELRDGRVAAFQVRPFEPDS